MADSQRTPAPDGALTFGFSQSTFNRFQFVTVSVMIALTLFHYLWADAFGKDMVTYVSGAFDAGRENSIPTWFSILNLLLASVLLFVIARHAKTTGDPVAKHWIALSVLMLALSMDEGASLHERLQKTQQFTGVLIPVLESHPWVLYGGIFAAAAFVFFIPFLRQIGPKLAFRFMLAGGLFIAGALGLEFMAAWMVHNEIAVRGELPYMIRRAGEEACEMYGIALFNCFLFDEIRARGISIEFRPPA
jgi:hypothetical protein